MSMPIITLSNGLKVGNFSSPHPFNFEDGSILPACEPERSKAGSLKVEEVETEGIKGTTDIDINFLLSESVEKMLDEVEELDVDIVLVPFPVLGAIHKAGRPLGKCRVIRVKDRQTKDIHIDRFCV